MGWNATQQQQQTHYSSWVEVCCNTARPRSLHITPLLPVPSSSLPPLQPCSFVKLRGFPPQLTKADVVQFLQVRPCNALAVRVPGGVLGHARLAAWGWGCRDGTCPPPPVSTHAPAAVARC